MDIFLPILGLLMIMVFIVGATIKINSLMKGKIINALLNKKILLIIASILVFLFTLAFMISYFDGFVYYWDDYLWLAYSIALIFAMARYNPILVSYLMEIHQNNLEDIKEQELKEAE